MKEQADKMTNTETKTPATKSQGKNFSSLKLLLNRKPNVLNINPLFEP